MKHVRVPEGVLAFEIRAGRVTTGGSAVGGAIGGAAAGAAAAGLRKASGAAGSAGLQFPPCCCNCLAEGPGVRPIATSSVVNRGVAYTFRFPVPHCTACSDTANRKRLGVMGLFAIWFASSILTGIAVAVLGESLERSGLTQASFWLGPLVGVVATVAWSQWRRPRPGQASAHQAVFVSKLEMEFSGAPKGAILAFANNVYADRFMAANRSLGLSAR